MIAALATLLGGMMIGAGTANAEQTPSATEVVLNGSSVTQPGDEFKAAVDDTNKFTTTDGTNLRQFAYVKLADYSTNASGTSLVSATGITSNAKVMEAFKALGYDSTKDNADPFTWLGSQSEKAMASKNFRAFITALSQAGLPTTNVQTETLDGNQLKLNLEHDGLYMIVDLSGKYTVAGDCPVTYTKISPILMGTLLTGVTGGEGTVLVSLGDKGTVDVKQNYENNCTPTNGQFEKTDDNHKPLAGAEFDLYEWNKADAPTEADFTTDALKTGNVTKVNKDPIVSGPDGIVHLNGIKNGADYIVVETKTPNGYLSEYAANLYVKVDNNGNLTITVIGDEDHKKLLDQKNDGTYRYMNITNTTELPKTGAAGVALFVALAALLAGAAGVVYVKSRRTKAMLR
ncbi:prealbumin-like fold domain-containing protein [Bifidobacterium rousetti]|uniref:prealbumin-like fold domain-containing protein n=1 Tax=Bifidobacterium rousetti TaxID=2045439 RepID=UPI001CC27E38|nr:prealbumin-like fold domain-containing protein [Bifidobacterium rousetti]